jgi:hypothetical protein
MTLLRPVAVLIRKSGLIPRSLLWGGSLRCVLPIFEIEKNKLNKNRFTFGDPYRFQNQFDSVVRGGIIAQGYLCF